MPDMSSINFKIGTLLAGTYMSVPFLATLLIILLHILIN